MAIFSLTVSIDEKTRLDRLMSLVAEVHPGEAATALLLTLNIFLLLAAYYIIKPVRETLILTGGGAEIKSYTGAVQALLFLFIVPAYGAFASQVNRIRLINGVTLFFVANLIIFFVLGNASVPLSIPFFLWVGVFNVMVIAQFWSFANDLYTPEQGKRLFAIVGIGSSVGAIAGSKLAGMLFKSLDVFLMMLVSAALLVVCLLLTNLIHRREQNRARDLLKYHQADQPLSKDGGFQLVIRHRYLLFIGLVTLVINVVNTNGEYILGKTFSRVAREAVAAGTAGNLSERQLIGHYYAEFQFWQNLLGALFQMFLVSRILKYLDVRGALFILPAISASGYTVLAAAPILAYIRIAKILENSLDYSLHNTVRHALFLPTSREAKYKAKQTVDTFFWRTGDMLSGLSVFVGTGLLGLEVKNFAVFNLGLVVLWVALAAGIVREHRKLTALPVTESAPVSGQ